MSGGHHITEPLTGTDPAGAIQGSARTATPRVTGGAVRTTRAAPSPLRVLSLFAGIGGFDLGLERTGGFETVAFCEIEPFAQRVLAKHWPHVPCYSDVRELTSELLAADGIAVDVIVGGFPCQDISAAGTRAGLYGERSGLFWEIDRLIGELRPAVIVLENSPELLDGWMGDILGALAKRGYHAEWEVVPAAFVGAPHLRDRVWIVAYSPEVSGIHELHLGDAIWGGLPHVGNPWATAAWDSPAAGTCRVDDGVPNRVDRTGALGNAVVPQIPELIGQAILSAEGRQPIPYNIPDTGEEQPLPRTQLTTAIDDASRQAADSLSLNSLAVCPSFHSTTDSGEAQYDHGC